MAAYNNNKQGWYGLNLQAWSLWVVVLCCCLLCFVPEIAQADYPWSALRGKLVINEVLIKQSGANTIAENDEFIELYNAGTTVINLAQLRLIDGNLFTNELDGTVGSITGSTSAFTFSCVGTQVCEGSTLLAPKTYAVVWVGQKSAMTTATNASFQAWLRNAPKLNDSGDDLWLYEQTASGLALVDYMSVGSTGTGSAVNTNVPASVWDFAYNNALSAVAKGQSVSLTPNGQMSSGACWEMTTSGNAGATCPAYLPTLDSDNTGSRISSMGDTNTRLHFISGRVFHDTNVNGLDDTEAGLGKVTIVLYDHAKASCKVTRTDATGGYRFTGLTNGNYLLYETVQTNSTTCPPQALDPSGYLSSSANQLAVTIMNQAITGVNFADLYSPSLLLDNSRVIQPQSVAVHPHQFRASTAGKVSFSLVEQVADPVVAWSSQLYQDVNCSQTLDAGDMPLNTSLAVVANETVCLLVKVLSPAHVSSGAMYTVKVQSAFTFGDGSLMQTPSIQTRSDLTKVAAALKGAGNLVLTKSVWNLSRNRLGNLARPNEVLRYTVNYSNNGNSLINTLALHDTLPAFTSLIGTPTCVATPSSLGTCQVSVNGSALLWQFNGQLSAGESGTVAFEVVVH